MIFSNYDTVSNCSSPSMCMCKKIHLQILFLKVQCQIHTRGISVSASQTWKLLLSKIFLHKNYYSWGKCFLTKYLRAQNMHKIFLQPQNLIVFFFFSSFTTKIKCLCFVLVFFTVRHLRAIFFPCTPKSRNDGCGVTCEHHFYELRLSRALICFHAIVVFFFFFFFLFLA